MWPKLVRIAVGCNTFQAVTRVDSYSVICNSSPRYKVNVAFLRVFLYGMLTLEWNVCDQFLVTSFASFPPRICIRLLK